MPRSRATRPRSSEAAAILELGVCNWLFFQESDWGGLGRHLGIKFAYSALHYPPCLCLLLILLDISGRDVVRHQGKDTR